MQPLKAMTITEAKLLLLTFYQSNNAVNLDTDYIDITEEPNLEDEQYDKAILEKALKLLETAQLVHQIKFNSDGGPQTSWVLDKPLNMYEKTIVLTHDMSVYIANCINDYADNIQNTKIKVDPFNIGEREVLLMATIISGQV